MGAKNKEFKGNRQALILGIRGVNGWSPAAAVCKDNGLRAGAA